MTQKWQHGLVARRRWPATGPDMLTTSGTYDAGFWSMERNSLEGLGAGGDLLPAGGAAADGAFHDVEGEGADLALASREVDGTERVLVELVAGQEHAGQLVAGAV